ncbi:hypothetical protein HNP86_001869 [Methanococcus maripaludis]|uniref:Uncharacterized protein n=1 Tax=Methanococcus maripaludis TaxID=39152 RepID=A0A7J9NVK6_METMI|nr:hypothetical protein [Methanococcus maripaludis]MBA2851710.1 hypothetical protein [Methanococcus maripaludis]
MPILLERTFENSAMEFADYGFSHKGAVDYFTSSVYRSFGNVYTGAFTVPLIENTFNGKYLYMGGKFGGTNCSGYTSTVKMYIQFRNASGAVIESTNSRSVSFRSGGSTSFIVLHKIPDGATSFSFAFDNYKSGCWSYPVPYVYLGGYYILEPDRTYKSCILGETSTSQTYNVSRPELTDCAFITSEYKPPATANLSVNAMYNTSTATFAVPLGGMGTWLSPSSTVDNIQTIITSNVGVAFERQSSFVLLLDKTNNMRPIKLYQYENIINHNPLQDKAVYQFISPLNENDNLQEKSFKFDGDGLFDCILTPEIIVGDLTGITQLNCTVTVKDSSDNVIDSCNVDLLNQTYDKTMIIPKNYSLEDLTLSYLVDGSGSVTETTYADLFLNMTMTRIV